MSYSKEYPNIPKIDCKSKTWIIALVMMVMCLLNHSNSFAESNKCPFQGFDNCAACQPPNRFCEEDDGFTDPGFGGVEGARADYGSNYNESGSYDYSADYGSEYYEFESSDSLDDESGNGTSSIGLSGVGGGNCQYTCTQCDENYELREAECVSCSAEQKAYDSESKECVDCSAKNKGFSPSTGQCNNCKPSCTECCDGCEIDAKGEIVYKMGGEDLSCEYEESLPGRWCQDPLKWSNTHCTDASKADNWCGGYGYFEYNIEKWCCPRTFPENKKDMYFKVPKENNENEYDRTYLSDLDHCLGRDKKEEPWKIDCTEEGVSKEYTCVNDMGLTWKEPKWVTLEEPKEEGTIAKCVVPKENTMLGTLNKVCLRCQDKYKLDGKHCVEETSAGEGLEDVEDEGLKVVEDKGLELLRCKYPKSKAGAWCRTDGVNDTRTIGSCTDNCGPYGYHQMGLIHVCCPRFFKAGDDSGTLRELLEPDKMYFVYSNAPKEKISEFTSEDVKGCKGRDQSDEDEFFIGDCRGKVEKCESIGGEWMYKTGEQNDSAFCKVGKGTTISRNLCEKYGGRIENETCVNLDCNESEVALKGQCFFKDYVKSDCKIAGCEQCLPSMVSCENCEDGKKLVNINQLSDEEYLNVFAKGNEDSISLAKKKSLLGLLGQKTCVDKKNRDRPGFDSRSLCKKLQDNQTAQDNQFAPGYYNDSGYQWVCPFSECEIGSEKNSVSSSSTLKFSRCQYTNARCDCFSCDEDGCISKTSGCKDSLCSVCDMDGECLVYEGEYCKIIGKLEGCNACSKGGLNDKRECYACDPGYNLNNGRCEKTKRTQCHQDGGVWSDENESCDSTTQSMCDTRINGKCRTDETECCSDGQITLTSNAESRCFTPLKKIWDEAKTNKTLKRTCNGDCNTQANKLGYTLFKDGDECRLPEDELVEKHFDDMKQTCIDEKLRWNPILKQCDNNCEEKIAEYLDTYGLEGGEVCDTSIPFYDSKVYKIDANGEYGEFTVHNCGKCKYGYRRIMLNDVCCSKKDKLCGNGSSQLKKQFQELDSDHELSACSSKRFPPSWEEFDFPSWREDECGKWTKDPKTSRDCLSEYQKFLTSKGKVHNSKSACEMAGGYPELMDDFGMDSENYIYDSGKYYKCTFPVQSVERCVENQIAHTAWDIGGFTELNTFFNAMVNKCYTTGVSQTTLEDLWYDFVDAKGNRDKATFRLGEHACDELHLATKVREESVAGNKFKKCGYCEFNKSPKSCDVRRDMKGEGPEFKDTEADSCEFCLHGFKTTKKGNKLTQDLLKTFSDANTFTREDFEQTLTEYAKENNPNEKDMAAFQKVLKVVTGKIKWKGIFKSKLFNAGTAENLKLLKKLKFRSLGLPAAVTYLVAYLDPNEAHVCCWPHEGPEDGCARLGASMGANSDDPNNAEWISEENGAYLPPGCEYDDIHKEVNWHYTTEIECSSAGGTWDPKGRYVNRNTCELDGGVYSSAGCTFPQITDDKTCKNMGGEIREDACIRKVCPDKKQDYDGRCLFDIDHLADTMSVQPKEGQCPATFIFDYENDKCVITPPIEPVTVYNNLEKCRMQGGQLNWRTDTENKTEDNLIFNEEDERWYECNIEESKSCDGL